MSRHWIPNPSGFGGDRRSFRARQLYPELEQTPDINRGETRLAAEVAIAAITGQDVPSFAHHRAFETLLVLAKG